MTRVTARIHRTPDGHLEHEYVVGRVAYPSIDALEATLNTR